MNILEAYCLLLVLVAVSGCIGLVTSRITAHWLRFEKPEINLATLIGVLLPMAVSLIVWDDPLIDRPTGIDVSAAYLALVASLFSLVIGSSVAFVMIAVSIVNQIYTVMCAVVDRMFVTRNR